MAPNEGPESSNDGKHSRQDRAGSISSQSLSVTTTSPSSSFVQDSLSATTLSSFPYTFTTLIDADHQSIDRLAGRVIHSSISLSTRLDVFATLLWRLIRHDISEELVMRPAFATHLGPPGASAAAQDRQDHAEIKGKLLRMYQTVSSAVERGEVVDESGLIAEIKALAAEMAVHMREESGVMIPRFEAVVDRGFSSELAWRYAMTLVLTPELEICRGRDGRGEEDRDGGRERCFQDVMAYARAEVNELRDILVRLEDEARMGRDDGYLEKRFRDELSVVGLTLEMAEKAPKNVEEIKGKL